MADANETSGVDGLVLLSSIVGESQIIILDHFIQYVASRIC